MHWVEKLRRIAAARKSVIAPAPHFGVPSTELSKYFDAQNRLLAPSTPRQLPSLSAHSCSPVLTPIQRRFSWLQPTVRSHPGQLSPLDTAMGLSKTSRILILLTIDALFFLLEISVGQFTCSCSPPPLS